MSGRRSPQSPTTLPSGTTGTHRSHSRQFDSSGQSSTESRIDSHDRYRIGGPGRLPGWPLLSLPAVGILDPDLENAAKELASGHFNRRRLLYDDISIHSRVTQGQPISERDTTLLITAYLEEHHDQMISILDDLIQALHGLGFPGRVEMIDPGATWGPLTFPPALSQQQETGWERTLNEVIEVLAAKNISWNQIMPANRGYWPEIAKPTIVIKTATLPQEAEAVVELLTQKLQDSNFCFEFMESEGLWGLFGSSSRSEREKDVRDSLGWPFPPTYHGMGISVSRSFPNSPSSTLGGYLKIFYSNAEHIVGISCYHPIRLDENGDINTGIDCQGATHLDWPCQSPSCNDIAVIKKPLEYSLSCPIPENAPPPIKAQAYAEIQESARKLKEATEFNPSIGHVVAVSGWRNVPCGPNLYDPFTFVDWACIQMSREHCTHLFNDISGMGRRLRESLPETLPFWRSKNAVVSNIVPVPKKGIPVFKQGRTSGLTVGTLGGLTPCAYKVDGLPGHLYHRAYIVHSRDVPRSIGDPLWSHPKSHEPFEVLPFCKPGDSGSWCLNGDGDLLGQLVGGDRKDGSGLILPFSTIVEDIERKLELNPGSVRLP